MGESKDAERPLPQIDAQRCDGCGLCMRACPHGVLAVASGRAHVAHGDACDYSGLCALICPYDAITLSLLIIAVDHTGHGRDDAPAETGGQGADTDDRGLDDSSAPARLV